jgi:hypothetical protein
VPAAEIIGPALPDLQGVAVEVGNNPRPRPAQLFASLPSITAERGVWLARNSVLGHQIKSLTSEFAADPTPLPCMPWSQAWGFEYHWDTPVPAYAGTEWARSGCFSADRSCTSSSLAWAASLDPVLPDPDCESAHHSEFGFAVAVSES